MQGGFNGANIFNAARIDFTDAAVKREMDDSTSQGGKAGPTVSAYRKAVDIMGSKSDVEIKLLAVPGIRNSVVTDYAIDAVENRFDSMYIMDIEERDNLNTVITSSAQNPHVANTVSSTSRDRALDYILCCSILSRCQLLTILQLLLQTSGSAHRLLQFLVL